MANDRKYNRLRGGHCDGTGLREMACWVWPVTNAKIPNQVF